MDEASTKKRSREPWTLAKQRKAEANWKAQHTVKITFQFNRDTDADILEWMETREETRTSYLRRIIREDIARSKKQK